MPKSEAPLRTHKVQAMATVALAAGMLWLLLTLTVAPSQGSKPDLPRYPRLESSLRDLVAAYSTGGVSAAIDFAAQHGVTLVEGLVRVVVVHEEEADQANIAGQIAALGGQVEAAYGPWTQGLLPVEALPALANRPGVRFVRRPWSPSLATTSEGVTVIGADEWQEAGFSGQGIKVGVLDLGFLGYTNRIAEGELPSEVITRSFVGAGSELDLWGHPVTQHGTACAEIVYDMAPDVQLYLVNAGTEVEWANAVDWLVAQAVNVISFSAGWEVLGPGDGTGIVAEKVNGARNAGILWVNAAGNHARQHWMGQWNDWDGNGWHNYSGTDETNEIVAAGGTAIYIGLRWDDPWGSSANDYDLFLFRENNGSLEEVTRSEKPQDGDDEPWERIDYTPSSSGVYYVAISKQPEAQVRTLELFSRYQDFHYQTASSSLLVPADSPGSLTVGATYWQNDALEGFSSQGPTRDGRTKPDLTAPDGVSVRSELYGGGFYGTSASAPHVAGASALVLEAFPTLTPAQVQSWLEGRAVDLGTVSKDNAYGAGRLRMPLGIASVSPAAVMRGTTTVTLQVSGDPFLATASFALKKPGYEAIQPSNVTWVSVSELTGTVNLSSAALGPWAVVVANTSFFTMSLPNGFLIASDRDFLPMIAR